MKKFVTDLLLAGFILRAEADAIKCISFLPEVELTDVWREEIKTKKTELVDYLQEMQIPLSYQQRQLWLLEQYDNAGESAYNIPLVFRIKGNVDFVALEKSFNYLLMRHQILQTVFFSDTDEPEQKILKSTILNFKIEDIEANKLAACLNKEISSSFDLSQALPIRVKIYRLNGHESVLAIILHHIAFDGWSESIFISELSACYKAFSRNADLCLPEIKLQYADYSLWQQQWLQSVYAESHIKYWEMQLNDLVNFELPTDFPRPKIQTFKGEHIFVSLNTELWGKIKEFSKKQHITLFNLFLANFYILLHRYYRQEDIVIGTNVANRSGQAFANVLGYFANVLPLRYKISRSISFVDCVKQIQDMVVEAQKHQEVPFGYLVDFLKTNRNATHSATLIFPVFFDVMINNSSDMLKLDGLTISTETFCYDVAKFDFTLGLIFDDQLPQIYVEYNTALFTRKTMEHLLNGYIFLLENCLLKPENPIGEMELVTDAERQRLLQMGESIDLSLRLPESSKSVSFSLYTEDDTFITLFERQAKRFYAHTAVSYDGSSLTYQELNNKANRLGKIIHKCFLKQIPEKSQPLVGVFLDRSFNMLISMLGVLKARGAYVPLDPAYPLERIKHILFDAKVDLIITENKFLQEANFLAIKENVKTIVCLDEYRIFDASEEDGNFNIAEQIKPHDLAYVIYTSGSTGLPKGVMIHQQGMLNHLRAKIELLKLNEHDVVAQNASQCFDISVWQFFAALLVGGEVAIFDNDTAHEPEKLAHAAAKAGVTVMEIVPAMLQMLFDSALRQDQDSLIFQSLRWMILTGEALSAAIARHWYDFYPNVPVVNAYGPTECSDDVTHYIVPKFEKNKSAYVPIGTAIPNMRMHVLDEDLQLIPAGFLGELCVSGVGVGLGYLNQPKLTAEKFVKNPHATKDDITYGKNLQLYKTGDLVRWLDDGNLEYLGRIDDQVKIRGFRVELGEIETILNTHPKLKQGIVIIIDHDGQKQIIAYYISEIAINEKILAKELKDFLSARLPEYMIPSAFVRIEKVPLTVNGKVDKKKLPQAEYDSYINDEYIAPQTEVELQLANIWKEILHLEQVGIKDNFFSLGGDSIMSIQVISRAKQLGYDLKPKDLFAGPTLADLSQLVEQRGVKSIVNNYSLAEGNALLLPIQKRFFEFNYPNENHFNQSFLLKLNITLSLQDWLNIFKKLIEHHDALRLRFSKENNTIRQYYAKDFNVSLEEVDLTGNEQPSISIADKCAQLQASLNIYEGPIFRAVLFSGVKGGCQRLFIVMHHLVIDGVSWRILFDDINNLVKQLKQKQDLSLPPKTDSYAKWGEGLKSYLINVKDQQNFWESVTTNIAQLPKDGDEACKNLEPIIINISLTAEQTAQVLNEAPKAYYTQINDVLLSALSLAIKSTYGLDVLAIDLEAHGREGDVVSIDISRTIGWFTSLYPVLLQLPKTKELSTDSYIGNTIKAIKEQLRTIKDKGLGYGVLRYYLGDEDLVVKLASETPDILFNYLGVMDESKFEGCFSIERQKNTCDIAVINKSSHGLNIDAWVINRQMHFSFAYDPHKFSHKSMESLAQAFNFHLLSIITHCIKKDRGQHTVSDFDLRGISQGNLENILHEKSSDNTGYIVEEF